MLPSEYYRQRKEYHAQNKMPFLWVAIGSFAIAFGILVWGLLSK